MATYGGIKVLANVLPTPIGYKKAEMDWKG